MYKTHQPRIAAWSRSSPDNFGRLLQFVILTAREPLYNVPANTEIARNGGQDAMSILFGWKHSAYVQAWERRETILSFCEHVMASDRSDREKTEELLEYISGERGFALVKAGFVIQLAFGLSGCLDTHNAKLYGFAPEAFIRVKALKTAKARRKLISRYCSAQERAGSTEFLWDQWCKHVADLYPAIYKGAYHVSALHCAALGLSEE